MLDMTGYLQKRKSPEQLDPKVSTRIDRCERINESNCIGTALFLVGMQDRDVSRSIKKVYNEELRRLRRLEEPEIGSLVGWLETYSGRVIVEHMAGVISVDPLLVAHRIKACGPFYTAVSFSIPDEYYNSNKKSKVKFYLPKCI